MTEEGGADADDAEASTGDDGDFCETGVTQIRNAIATLGEAAREENAKDGFETGMAALRGIEMPDQISDDWETLTTAMHRSIEIVSTLEDSEPTSDETVKLTTELQALQSDLDGAGQSVEKYVEDSCGVSLSDPAE